MGKGQKGQSYYLPIFGVFFQKGLFTGQYNGCMMKKAAIRGFATFAATIRGIREIGGPKPEENGASANRHSGEFMQNMLRYPKGMEEKREKLAEYAHKAWSGWMEYMFSKCRMMPDGSAIMPAWAVERWTRQMNTSYADMPLGEKDSDRDEADKMLRICDGEEE